MSNYTTKYLTNPRNNRNSGAKIPASMKNKVQTVEYREVCVKEYQGKNYIVYYTILESINGEILKVESDWILQD